MSLIQLNVGETMYLRTVGSKFLTGEVFNSLAIRKGIDTNSVVVKMSNSFIEEITSTLCSKGLLVSVDKDKNLYSLTEFGKSTYEAIMDKVAGRARCASGNTFSGEGKSHE